MTIMEALQWANTKLKKTQIDSPMLDAEILLAFVLGVTKSWLFGHFTDPLKPHQEEKFLLLIDRRAKHEPVAYLIQKKEFFGREFFVDYSVLIPRPATEILVEHAIAQFQTSDSEQVMFADIGTGSGAIAITLAAQTHTPVLAIDQDKSALSVAKKNAFKHSVEKWIDFQEGNLLEPLVKLFQNIYNSGNPNVSSVYPFRELIICANLPYLTNRQMETLEPDVHFEPVRALVSGVDGLDAYWELFRQCKKNRDILPRKIITLIEIDPLQTDRACGIIRHLFSEAKIRIAQDLQKNDRIIIAEY